MAGYKGYSMSNNAIEAYEEGYMPLSKWTKGEILNAIDDIRPDLVHIARKVSLPILKRYVLEYKEWHHSSMYYNQTDFYGIDEDYLEKATAEQFLELAAMKEQKKKKEAVIERRAKCHYLEWSGTRSHPHAEDCYEEGVIRGNWFYPDNGGGKKKSISSRGFYVVRFLDVAKDEDLSEYDEELSKYIDSFNESQMYDIRKGLEKGLDVSVYA
ncbi:MAG: hypothetical protein HUJ53_09665, partial [Holdemanella sp.]|nr:hypothetical protein [Holdemanella sp.]